MSIDRSQPTRFCLACRYSLQGISTAKCPECGRSFDPDDPRTTSPHPHATGPQWLARVGRVLIMLTGILAGAGFVVSAMGVDPILLALFAVLAAPLLLSTLVITAMPIVPLTRRQRIWGPVVIAVFVSVVWTHWPFCINFALHKPAMQRLADQVRAGASAGTPRRVGFFVLKDARIIPEGSIGFQLTGDSGGGTFLVWRAPGSTRIWYNTNWEISLGDDWYYVYED